jgi:hypothetical protein
METLPEGYEVHKISSDLFQYAHLPADERQTLHIAKGQFIVVEKEDRGYNFLLNTISSSKSGAVSRFLANNNP